MLTEVTNFYSTVSWGENGIICFKDPLTLLVDIHFCAVLWSFKETVEPTSLPGEEKALLGVPLPTSLLVLPGPLPAGCYRSTGALQTCPGCLYLCWELGLQWGSPLADPSRRANRVNSQPGAAARMIPLKPKYDCATPLFSNSSLALQR